MFIFLNFKNNTEAEAELKFCYNPTIWEGTSHGSNAFHVVIDKTQTELSTRRHPLVPAIGQVTSSAMLEGSASVPCLVDLLALPILTECYWIQQYLESVESDRLLIKTTKFLIHQKNKVMEKLKQYRYRWNVNKNQEFSIGKRMYS